MQEYVQKSIRTTLPRRLVAASSGSEFSQPLDARELGRPAEVVECRRVCSRRVGLDQTGEVAVPGGPALLEPLERPGVARDTSSAAACRGPAP